MDNAAVTAQAVRVAVIADDLTGAGDTVVQFAQKGWKSWLLRTGEVPQLPPVAAVARALNTRALPDAEASERTREATCAQLAAGVTRLYLKIDSTMRGSVAAQLSGALEAWRSVYPEAFVVLCPAYPVMGRVIRDGRLWVNGVSLEDSPAGSDPVTPMKSSVFTELVPGAAVVPAGSAAELLAAISAAAKQHPVIVVEATEEVHLQTLAQVVAQLGTQALPAGSAGLALALTEAWLPVGEVVQTPALPQAQGTMLLLRSSANEVSRRQVARLLASLPAEACSVLTPNVADLASEDSLRAWIGLQSSILPKATLLLVSAPEERVQGGSLVDVSRRVAQAMATIVASMVSRGLARTLILLGGDGADATLDALGVKHLRVIRSVVEGVPVAEAEGRDGQRFIVVTKAGGFGDENTLITIAGRLQAKSASL